MRERGLALDQLASGAPTASTIGGDDKGRAAVDDRAEAAVDDGVKAVERGTEAKAGAKVKPEPEPEDTANSEIRAEADSQGSTVGRSAMPDDFETRAQSCGPETASLEPAASRTAGGTDGTSWSITAASCAATVELRPKATGSTAAQARSAAPLNVAATSARRQADSPRAIRRAVVREASLNGSTLFSRLTACVRRGLTMSTNKL